jgi:hypothetical protein
MIHWTPCLGWIDHGPYNVQPGFFHDLARANGYEMLLATLAGISMAVQSGHPRTPRLRRPAPNDGCAVPLPPAGGLLLELSEIEIYSLPITLAVFDFRP